MAGTLYSQSQTWYTALVPKAATNLNYGGLNDPAVLQAAFYFTARAPNRSACTAAVECRAHERCTGRLVRAAAGRDGVR